MANEKRLIDANAVRHKINAFAASVVYRGSNLMITGKDGCNPSEYTRGYEQGVLDATNIVTGQPTVDAVEVKCKVGDYVYALWEAPVKLKYIIYCAEVKEIRISMRNCRLTTTYILEPIDYRGHRREYRDEEFGTLVFKDEADAERKLYPCEHCISGTYRTCEGCSYGERKDNG